MARLWEQAINYQSGGVQAIARYFSKRVKGFFYWFTESNEVRGG